MAVVAQVAEHDHAQVPALGDQGRDQQLAPAFGGLAGPADDRAVALAEQGQGGQVGRVGRVGRAEAEAVGAVDGPERAPRPLGEQQEGLLGPE